MASERYNNQIHERKLPAAMQPVIQQVLLNMVVSGYTLTDNTGALNPTAVLIENADLINRRFDEYMESRGGEQ